MKLAPKDLAKALYLAARQEPDKTAGAYVKNLVAAAKKMGIERSLPDVLAALPAAMEDVDAETRVTIESARAIDDETAAAALAAADIATENVDVVRRVLPELVGGLRIRTADRVVDATVRRSIDELIRAVKRPMTAADADII